MAGARREAIMANLKQRRDWVSKIRLALTFAVVLGLGAVTTYSAQAKVTLGILHTFIGDGIDGAHPVDNGFLARDSSGNLYGTTFEGGAYGFGCVFKLRMKANETILYDFGGGSDGANPFAGVIVDSQGNIYGTTENGGAYGFGTVFKVSKEGTETVLYSFSGGADGGTPYSSVVSDSSGTLYGTTFQGGTYGFGTVYAVTSAGEETVLYSFSNGADGAYPNAGLILDSQGNLLGTTVYGGTYDFGTVFSVSSTGSENLLYSFTGGVDGAWPFSGLVSDTKGNLYGTTVGGGKSGYGTVFKLNSTGKETTLCSFTSGGIPYAGLVLSKSGTLYGTLAGGYGGIFEVTEGGHETVLYGFRGGVTGGDPMSGLVSDGKGAYYGVTYLDGKFDYEPAYGTLFKLIP